MTGDDYSGISEDVFWGNVNQHAPGGCWVWLRHTDKYGIPKTNMRRNGKQAVVSARRVAWVLTKGPIPPGLDLRLNDATRCMRGCLNPQHCTPLTRKVITSLMSGGPGKLNGEKTECLRGHSFALHGRRNARGDRACRRCVMILRRAKKASAAA